MIEIEAEANISSIVNSLKEEVNSRFCDINSETWFRGQPNYTFELKPSIFREQYAEAEMYDEFIRRYPDYSYSHKNVFEWLTLMQHYGLPTRLLDWSTNLLVAIFFAANEDQEEDGAVFAFNPGSKLSDYYFRGFLEILVTSKNRESFYEQLIKVTYEEYGESSKINGIAIKEWKADFIHLNDVCNDVTRNGASEFKSFEQWYEMPSIYKQGYSEMKGAFSKAYRFKPPQLNPRIRQQHGCFTLHGGKYFKETLIGKESVSYKFMEFIKPYNIENSENSLVKIKVRSVDKSKLLKELALTGITESTIFPEMEYQTKDIKHLHKIFPLSME